VLRQILKERAWHISRALFVIILGLVASSCRPYLFSYGDSGRSLASENGFVESHLDVGSFVLTAFQNTRSKSDHLLHVYIEGDGNAFTSRGRPTLEPTPKDPMALQLAVSDQANNVGYLARPCQFTARWPSRNCRDTYWTSHRFAKEVVGASSKAITELKRRAGASKVLLIGYSGGGAIAALVAAQRDDLFGLITIAGTMDHQAWTRHHDISTLTGSLNPKDVAGQLKSLPQIHYVGGEDEIMPKMVAQSYQDTYRGNGKSKLFVLKSYSHDCCWQDNWPALISHGKDILARLSEN